MRWRTRTPGDDGGTGPILDAIGDSMYSVTIKGIIDRLVKDFGLVLRGIEVYHVPGCKAQWAAVAWQDSGVVDGR